MMLRCRQHGKMRIIASGPRRTWRTMATSTREMPPQPAPAKEILSATAIATAARRRRRRRRRRRGPASRPRDPESTIGRCAGIWTIRTSDNLQTTVRQYVLSLSIKNALWHGHCTSLPGVASHPPSRRAKRAANRSSICTVCATRDWFFRWLGFHRHWLQLVRSRRSCSSLINRAADW